MSKKCQIMRRMKDNYENRQSHSLLRKVPVIIRIDGKAFHTYTKRLDKPFDSGLIQDMNETAIYLCKNIQGAKCAYTQSDEISILVTDYDDIKTEAWLDYDQSKVESISASLATGIFNQLRIFRQFTLTDIDAITTAHVGYWEDMNHKIANFDSRSFNIPKEDVANYFYARQKDAVKNSISMLARQYYSHKELENKNSSEMQEMIFQKDINWNDLHWGIKRGRFIVKNTYANGTLIEKPFYVKDNKICFEGLPSPNQIEYIDLLNSISTIRTRWEVIETPLTFNHKHFEQWL